MQFNENLPNRAPNPRRKQRSKMQIIKEVYLPVIFAGAALLTILIFIIGSIVLKVQEHKIDRQASINASIQQSEEDARLAQELETLSLRADNLAAGYDYDAAIALLSSYTGSKEDVAEKIAAYEDGKTKLVAWEDPTQIVNLSLQLLIADAPRAYNHSVYGASFNHNFITTDEFSNILQQLYENGYILVNLDDFIEEQLQDDGSVIYKNKSIYLPSGKKPLVLTQTNVNYNIYLVDSDGDRLPDKNGGGFASKLLIDSQGNFTCEMVDANGQTVTGAYDMVPILESFIAQHPDFSYRGARAVLALTGYNGLFGYRTDEQSRTQFGEAAYQEAVNGAKQVAEALQERGYTLACYTYENIPYGTSGIAEIQSDLNSWNNEVVPIIGATDVLVYAQQTDISDVQDYSGDKYELLSSYGFRYYLGFCTDGKPATTITDNYVRQGRILLTGANLATKNSWFNGLFDPSIALDKTRPSVI